MAADTFIKNSIEVNIQSRVRRLKNSKHESGLLSGTTEEPNHMECASLNPDDMAAIHGQELKRAKSVCALREEGWQNLSSLSIIMLLANHGHL